VEECPEVRHGSGLTTVVISVYECWIVLEEPKISQ
jgi:hypothetical protein